MSIILKDIIALAKQAVKPTPNAKFSVEDANGALRAEINKLAGNYNDFRRNKLDVYQIIQEVADEVVPNRVVQIMGQFAEIRRVGHGETVNFTRKVGRLRAKQFLTAVGLSGVYETFRLDKATFTVPINAQGIAAYIDFERFLSGAETLADSMEVIVEALTDALFIETQRALRAAISNTSMPVANKVIASSYNAAQLQKLVLTVSKYGTGAVIFATEEFIIEMGPDAIVPPDIASGIGGVYDPSDISDVRNTGFVRMFRGTPIVRIPQSFTDETNTHTVIDPQLAYIFPTGGEKIVKIVIEGETVIDDWQNRDRSMEIQAYKKFGAAILTFHNWGIYQNTAIPQTLDPKLVA